MSPYYFLGKWIVELNGIGQLIMMADDFAKMGFEIRELGSEVNEQGLSLLSFAIRISSRDKLAEVNTTAYNVEIIKWTEVSKKVFLKADRIEIDPDPAINMARVDELIFHATRNEYTLNKDLIEAGRHYDVPISVLNLSEQLPKLLARTGISTVGDLLDMLNKGDDVVLQIRGLNESLLEEIKIKLREHGYLE